MTDIVCWFCGKELDLIDESDLMEYTNREEDGGGAVVLWHCSTCDILYSLEIKPEALRGINGIQ